MLPTSFNTQDASHNKEFLAQNVKNAEAEIF